MKTFWVFATFTVGPVNTTTMKPEHKAIMGLLENLKPGEKLHQREIAQAKPWLGCHPKYEGDLDLLDPDATTLRKVRGDINELRRIFHAPILSEPSKNGGYWYPQEGEDGEKEIDGFMVDMQDRAIAQALGFLDTYDDMLVTFAGKPNLVRPFFEKLRKFLQEFVKKAKPPPPPPPPPKKKKKKKPPEDGGQGELGL